MLFPDTWEQDPEYPFSCTRHVHRLPKRWRRKNHAREGQAYGIVRFWAYVRNTNGEGGPVRLSLADGEYFEWHEWHATDEGYSACNVEIWREGWMLRMNVQRDGRDCDGRVSTDIEYECPVSRRDVVWNEHVKVWYPDWKEIRGEVNDRFARAAGY